ncbi:MAG: hypothetical protein ACRD47_09090 [Nitrososphaeraceae archaeon]
MILFGRKHLHISESDQIVDSLFKILSSVTSGSVKLEVANQPAMKIEINTNDDQVDGDDNNRTIVRLDLLEPAFFSAPDDQTGLFDKLRTAAEFAQKLTDNGITFSLLRKGKEAITLGEEARPSLSRIITKSNDIQVNSIKESAKLKNDFDDA